jgi:hypothetical protein
MAIGMPLLVGACKHGVERADCLSWQTHYKELAANVDKRVATCQGARELQSHLGYNLTRLAPACEHLEGKTVRSKDVACYMAANNSAAVKACNIEETSGLHDFASAAGDLDAIADSICPQR